MRLLILGGTIFLGRAIVEVALAHGHELTLFNRGKHYPELFPAVEKIHGDRDPAINAAGLAALASRQWDAVIDTCGYLPRVVAASAAGLHTAHYTFISSLSVYADFSRPGIDEGAPVGVLEDPATETITGESYGPLKALCEQAVLTAHPGRALVVRPGLIVGPHDYSGRFGYWVRRVAAGGTVLAPGRPTRQVEFIDVRDLAEWVVRMVEAQAVGVYNATGPAAPMAFGDLLSTCQAVATSDAAITWVDEGFLLERGVQPWSELPLWIPESDASMAGFAAFDCTRARAAGLTFRPVAETVRATLAWEQARDQGAPGEPPRAGQPSAGMLPAREAELLAEWQPAALPVRESRRE